MGKTSDFNLSKKTIADEHLHINLHKGKIDATLNVVRFIDKDTKQVVTYIPSLEVSGYGDNDKEAMEMLKFGLDNFGNYIAALTPDKIKAELSKMGWVKTMLNKDFSKAYVDIAGQLQNFNAEDNKVERLTLQTA